MPATATRRSKPVSTDEQRFLMRCVDWRTYRTISEALTGRHVRLTYDQGSLEFMTISSTHGNFSWLIGRLIVVLTEVLGLPIKGFSDMTCDREELERGLEPDESFYIDNEPRVRRKKRIDLAVDPPPDLAVEVDLRGGLQTRMAIYAALRVPEVWRFDGKRLVIHQLGADGQYGVVKRSPRFPFVSGADLVRVIRRASRTDENSVVRSFREWVREKAARDS